MIQSTTDHNLTLMEFERVELATTAAQKLLMDLQIRRDDLEKELELVTRPDTPTVTKHAPLSKRGYEYRGNYFTTKYKIQTYLGIVRTIWQEFADQREQAAAQLKAASLLRPHLATSSHALFSDWPDWKARKYSALLPDGWFASINLSQQQMNRNLKILAGCVGLRWGIDVRVCWV